MEEKPEKPKVTNPCVGYDFRYNAEGITEKDIAQTLEGVAKHYCFQLELSDTGYLHYQGRLRLIKKRRRMEALALFKLKPNYFQPTTCREYLFGDFSYAMKEDTRKDGPWTELDKPMYIPRQVREMAGLRPFQHSIIADVGVWNTRHVNIIYQEKGNVGKSTLVSHMRAYRLGRSLPPVNDMKDLLRMVCDLPTSNMYLFDMPRALTKDKQYQFFSAVETIKDGYAYDDRYTFKEKVFDCPNIWIFTNAMPDLNLLSRDRWKFWTINNQTFELEKYEHIY